jgi:hypothetical protein
MANWCSGDIVGFRSCSLVAVTDELTSRPGDGASTGVYASCAASRSWTENDVCRGEQLRATGSPTTLHSGVSGRCAMFPGPASALHGCTAREHSVGAAARLLSVSDAPSFPNMSSASEACETKMRVISLREGGFSRSSQLHRRTCCTSKGNNRRCLNEYARFCSFSALPDAFRYFLSSCFTEAVPKSWSDTR